MATFEITPIGALELDKDRVGRIVFRVRNTTTREVVADARVIPETRTEPGWFKMEGETRRSWAPGAVLEVALAVKVPMTTTSGDYMFHLEVVGVVNPDEDLGRSDDQRFAVRGITHGYVVTFVGAIAGGGLGLAVGLLPVLIALIVVLSQPTPTPTGGDLGTAIGQIIANAIALFVLLAIIIVVFGFIGVFTGLWIGPVVGASIALRLRRYDGVGATATFLAIIQPIWSIVSIVLVGLLSNLIENDAVRIVLLVVFAIIALAAPPWPARWLALWWGSRRKAA